MKYLKNLFNFLIFTCLDDNLLFIYFKVSKKIIMVHSLFILYILKVLIFQIKDHLSS